MHNKSSRRAFPFLRYNSTASYNPIPVLPVPPRAGLWSRVLFPLLGRTFRPLAALFLVVLALVVSLPSRANATPTNILLARNRTEPSITVDPVHPSAIVVGTNTNYDAPVAGTYPTGSYSSGNGGRSFSQGSVPTLFPYTIGADPTIAGATSGTIFYSYLGETPAYCSGGRSAIVVTRSFDHGQSFVDPVL